MKLCTGFSILTNTALVQFLAASDDDCNYSHISLCVHTQFHTQKNGIDLQLTLVPYVHAKKLGSWTIARPFSLYFASIIASSKV